MKRYSLAFSFLSASLILAFLSCKKINEATELGGNLIPAVDNVTTFESFLETETYNRPWLNDTTEISYYDPVTLGHITDPVFGTTNAEVYFSVGQSSYGVYPFINKKDSIVGIDSVVLSLSYLGAYGDTNTSQLVTVSEIQQSSNFSDTVLYKFTHASFTPLTTLGSKTYFIRDLKDSITVFTPGDTVVRRTANVLRIKLDNSLGERLRNSDTTINGAYYSDSTFKRNLKGLALQVNNGNGLAFFDLVDNSKTKLTVYYKAKVMGKDSAAATDFVHIPDPASLKNGMANIIGRTPGGAWETAISTPQTQAREIYIQSTPGSFGYIRIPALDTFKNKVIHRAEIIASVIPSSSNEIFTPPSLFLDRINKTRDTAFLLHNDLAATITTSIMPEVTAQALNAFGGTLLSDNTYHFNITRYVQGIVTRHEPNDTLRLYAPLRTFPFASNYGRPAYVPVNRFVGAGRAVLGGGSYPQANTRLRLRIIYSNL